MKIKPVGKNRGGLLVEPGPSEAQRPALAGETLSPALPAFKLKQILVPVDYTECMEKALFYAVPLARQFDATLTLLHVVETPYLPASEMGVLVEIETEADAKKQLEQLRTRLAGRVRCHTLVRVGRAEYEIIDVAKKLGSDLIVLSTHGRTGLERLLMGSTVEKVERRAGCPILVVRPHEHDFIVDDSADWQAEADSPEAGIETEMKASM